MEGIPDDRQHCGRRTRAVDGKPLDPRMQLVMLRAERECDTLARPEFLEGVLRDLRLKFGYLQLQMLDGGNVHRCPIASARSCPCALARSEGAACAGLPGVEAFSEAQRQATPEIYYKRLEGATPSSIKHAA